MNFASENASWTTSVPPSSPLNLVMSPSTSPHTLTLTSGASVSQISTSDRISLPSFVKGSASSLPINSIIRALVLSDVGSAAAQMVTAAQSEARNAALIDEMLMSLSPTFESLLDAGFHKKLG